MKRKPIDKQLLKRWRTAMFDITFDTVQDATGLSKPTLRAALKYGKATQNTIDILTAYFNQIPA